MKGDPQECSSPLVLQCLEQDEVNTKSEMRQGERASVRSHGAWREVPEPQQPHGRWSSAFVHCAHSPLTCACPGKCVGVGARRRPRSPGFLLTVPARGPSGTFRSWETQGLLCSGPAEPTVCQQAAPRSHVRPHSRTRKPASGVCACSDSQYLVSSVLAMSVSSRPWTRSTFVRLQHHPCAGMLTRWALHPAVSPQHIRSYGTFPFSKCELLSVLVTVLAAPSLHVSSEE